jgi:uncharacterized membrane protein YdjX (TVP38/TMEM64 family)
VDSGPPGGGTWTGVAVTFAGILIGAAVVLSIDPLRDAASDAVSGNTGSVREDLRRLDDAEGVLVVVALAMIHTVVWYPAEILDAAAGYVFGFWPALALVHACWIASALLAYYIGRHAARRILYTLIGRRRFTRMEDAIERGGVSILLAARLVPIVPFSLTGLVAGAAHVPLFRFIWTTAVGYLPITAYFIYLGSRLEDFSISDPIVWIGGILLIAAIFGVRRAVPNSRDL